VGWRWSGCSCSTYWWAVVLCIFHRG